MIPYEKINYIKLEIQDRQKVIQKEMSKKVRTFRDDLCNQDEFKEVVENYKNVVYKIIDNDYKQFLKKFIPEVLKLHKDKIFYISHYR